MTRESDAPGPGVQSPGTQPPGMKLATLRDGSRDGRLVVVGQDVTQASDAHHVAPTLQHALDDWDRLAPHLDLIARGIESGGQPLERFHEREALAPLPRTPGWIATGPDGTVVRQQQQRAPRATVPASDRDIDFGVAVILGGLPEAVGAAEAAASIRLVVLFAHPRGEEIGPSLSPVAVTPEALGPYWSGNRVSARLLIDREDRPEAYETGPIDFGALAAGAARTRPIAAGTLMSVAAAGGPVRLGAEGTFRLEMRDASGRSIFGAIELRRAAIDHQAEV